MMAEKAAGHASHVEAAFPQIFCLDMRIYVALS